MARSEFLGTALAASHAAAGIVRKYYRAGARVRLKPDQSPVTIADVESEQIIRRTILGRFPDHGFYGEETGRTDAQADYLWLVDPIDGTKAFVRGYPMFSTQIALMHRGRLVLGVSHACIYGELAWAERGGGAWLDGRRLAVSDVASIEQSTLSTGNLRRLASGPRWAALGRLVERLDRIRGYGDFLHYHLLAGGHIDAVVESDIHILDVAALAVIVEEAGGRVTDLEGSTLDLQSSSILASNSRLHETLLAAFSGR